MKILKQIKTIRFNQNNLEQIKLLMEAYPKDYPTFSRLIRSAINQLYEWKIRETRRKKNGGKTRR
jgi:hypothetical protein